MASKGVNKVIIVGNLGQDPETKFAASGSAISNISVATSESWKDKSTGQPQERTEWHRVVFFNRLAEIAGEYLRKGSKVYIEGSLRTRKWQDQSGLDRYTTEIVANEMQMLDSRGDGASQSGAYQQAAPQHAPQAGGYQQPAAQAAPQHAPQAAPTQAAHQQAPQQGSYAPQGAPRAPAPAPIQHAAPPAMDSFDEDIPF